MSLDTITRGVVSGQGQDVDANHCGLVVLPAVLGGNFENQGGLRVFSENDPGLVTGASFLMSNECDEDYRSRVATDVMLDEENFCYTAQNTGKHTYVNTTMTNGWTTGSMQTNSGNIVTTATGTMFGTYAMFPVGGTQTLSFDMEASFSAQPVSNLSLDFGGFQRAAAATSLPLDGAYFRLTSAGLQGVVNYNGVETTTGIFLTAAGGAAWSYINNKKYQFILYITPRAVQFWINDNGVVNLYGTINTPIGNGQPCASSAVPFSVRHAIAGGAASGVLNFNLARYSVRLGGPTYITDLGESGSRIMGSYQGLSGGTLGSIGLSGVITAGNSANPTPATPTTTTAALGTGLGGRFWETAALAVNTDGIIDSYQVPAGTATLPGRRLKIIGLYINSYIQTVLAGGPVVAEWFIAFGHTAVSLATAESQSVKAPRRITLPIIQTYTSAQAVSTQVAQNLDYVDFKGAPIYVNPGEFFQVCKRYIGTVLTSGTIVNQITPVFTWE